MRFSTIALCSLTALVAWDITAKAMANPIPEANIQESASSDNSFATVDANSELIQPIAAPEIQLERSFAQKYAQVEGNKTSQPQFVENSQNLVAQESAKISEINAISDSASVTAESSTASKEPGTIAQSSAADRNGADALRLDKSQLEFNRSSRTLLAQDDKAGVCSPMNQTLTAQGTTDPCERPVAIPPLTVPEPYEFEASPALSIYIPVGFGADRNSVWVSGTYQTTREDGRAITRGDGDNDGAVGIGVGLGDADKALGVELGFTTASFDDRTAGLDDGGFNIKLHRRFRGDMSIAIGSNGFANFGNNDFEQSKYGVITKIFRTRDSVYDLFSRVALTVGVGDGQFRSLGAVRARENNANFFTNAAFRVARPLSAILEWTGQDLSAGLSIVPLKNVPWVITPAVRDIVGAGEGARFVLGTGVTFQF